MTARERLLYTGDHDAYLPGSTGARPDLVQPQRPDPDHPDGPPLPATTVEVNRDSAELLIARGDFELIELAPGEELVELPLAVEEPIPLDRQVAIEEAAPTEGVSDETGHAPEPSAEETLRQLRSEELDDALADAGLPRAGSDQEKRDRLRMFYSATAHTHGTTTTAISLHALQQAQAERDAAHQYTSTTSTER